MQPFVVELSGGKYTFTDPVKILDLIQGDVHPYICCTVNNRIRELSYELSHSATVELFTQKDYNAIKVYETSLRFLLVMACSRAFPGKKVKLSYNMSRSIYLTFVHSDSSPERFDLAKMQRLKTVLDDIIAADYPIVRRVLSNEDAEALYRRIGFEDKIEILPYRPEKTVHLNECDGYINYMYGHMVPSTGHIRDYRFRLFGAGILVQYPRSEENGCIPPFEEAAVYGRTLKETYQWSRLVRTDSIAGINHHVEEDGPVDFINLCESNHNNMLAELGKRIYRERDSIRLVCVAGPSSSGKTTFSNRLRLELMSLGLNPIRISVDDYYVDRDKTPLDENGEPDFECLEALDLEQFNTDMLALINGETVTLPHFDFSLGKRTPGRTLSVEENQPIIVEGIHALNDRLTDLIPKHQKYRIFIAPQAQINLDNHTPISLTDLRLLRRLVRDHQFRGTPAEQTMAMWPSVRRGEFRWIYATQENADFVFNSLLPYEMCAMKKYALPLLRQIDSDSPHFPLANRLVKFLKIFVDMDDTWVPSNSILREFIGGSCFQDV